MEKSGADIQLELAIQPIPDGVLEEPKIQSSDLDINQIKRRENIQFAALCIPLFLAGYNDGSTGPLLPTIQKSYHVSFTVLSILFGFILGGVLNIWFTDRFGFGKTLVIGIVGYLGAFGQIIGYTLMIPKPPYPVFVIGFAINGFGLALQDAQANSFVTTMHGSNAKMNFLHGIYGCGALIAPLISTQFSKFNNWSLYYCTSLGLSVMTFCVLSIVFRFQRQEVLLVQNGHLQASHSEGDGNASKERNTFKQVLSLKAVHLLAIYLLVYVGVEVTLGGWIVTFIIDKRGGGHSSGYISAGFFGGLTCGRMVLHYINRFISEKNMVFVYAALCIALEITIWLVPSLVGNSISVSFIGFFLGPLYPTAMNLAGEIIPQKLLPGSIGWMAACGVAGSALLPVITGALANRFGIISLQPFLMVDMILMLGLWGLLRFMGRSQNDQKMPPIPPTVPEKTE
ncbi:hypothetical protein Clacol_009992 [Clathrus columnatus]|uniref:MFS general substrate transporter n=1 Tax=Clathrus columnatus TaxID=1419009 RepID=A0AAV5ASJ2_9AGAM|nr:hypothetical protein Clacol_009992 [Clathrus columnatus]